MIHIIIYVLLYIPIFAGKPFSKIFKTAGLSSGNMAKIDKGFNTKLILPIFIVFILVTSMFGFMWSGSNTKVEYKGFKFTRLDTGMFRLKVENIVVEFRYFPSELEWINSSGGIGERFDTPMIYFTSNPDSDYKEQIAEMHKHFNELLDETRGIYVQNAFTSESEYNLPVITCENATLAVPVISMEKSNSTEIILDQNCIVVNGKNRQEMLMAYERLLYIIFGVTE